MRLFNRDRASATSRRTVKVGWLLDPAAESSFVYDAPEALRRPEANPHASSKSVQHCPAVLDFERRLFVVSCPVDVSLRILRQPDGSPMIGFDDGEPRHLAPDRLASLIHLMPRDIWRHPERPVVQFVTPYRFVADDPVYLNQLPPFLDYFSPPQPGVLVGGRFPLDVWPRLLMWAFEWYDTQSPVHLRRGEPWFYVRFDLPDPAAHVRLVAARMTTELAEYCHGLDGVTNYVNQTFSLFATARSRRPKRLLVER